MPLPTATPTEVVYQSFHILPPPVAGSAEDLADMQAELNYQATRTTAECALAQAGNTLNFENTFGPSTGVLTEAEVQLANAVAQTTITEVANVTGYYKTLFKRNRPYVQNSAIVPCITEPGGYSYPSTHATTGMALALALADLFPGKATAILNQGLQIGLNRLIGGVHFPTDINAGQELAEQIYVYLVGTSAHP